nr:MAG TPA: hypothetical protein [Caudoviricetes sp.]
MYVPYYGIYNFLFYQKKWTQQLTFLLDFFKKSENLSSGYMGIILFLDLCYY